MGLSHRIKRSSLEVGDHIYAWRISYTYSHHGIYIGDDTVIHFTPHGVVSSSVDEFLRFWELGCSKLRLYKYSSKQISIVLKRGGTCTTAASDDGHTVVHRAKQLLENGFGTYNLRKRNCENFAVYCKTGLYVVKDGGEEDIAGLSTQVESVKCNAIVITTSVVPVIVIGAIIIAACCPPGVAVIGMGLSALAAANMVAQPAFSVISGGVVYHCKRRLEKDIGIRKDVKKKADVASTSKAASAYTSSSEEEEGGGEEEEDYLQNWTTEEYTDGSAMEAIIPSPSLQLLIDLSHHCVPGGYCPDALPIVPYIKKDKARILYGF
ncbi:hypothetical protein ABFX02_10G064100 [Erythranthe guttata]